MTTTLSFCILDDLEPCYGPFHVEIESKSLECIKTHICKLIKVFNHGKTWWDCTAKEFGELTMDCSEFFDREFFKEEDKYVDIIAKSLLQNDYFVKNRYEKYYVIAFALNYTRFDVFSKDCDKKLIKWRYDDEGDPIKGTITNSSYNENPVLTIMKIIGNHPNIRYLL